MRARALELAETLAVVAELVLYGLLVPLLVLAAFAVALVWVTS